MQFTGNDVTIRFSIAEDANNQMDTLLEQVAVMMTPASAKTLSILLSKTVADFEASNFVIDLGPNRESEIGKQIQAGKVPTKR